MGIFTRFRDIVSANINAMLDSAEDPEKMIKLMIREMEDTLVEIKSSCAGVMANGKRIRRQMDDADTKEQFWADRAQLAVNKSSDNLAREALLEKRRYTRAKELLQEELTEIDALIAKYQDDIRQLEEKLNNAREKQRVLVQRHIQARNKKRAQQEIRRADSSEAILRFDQYENSIERMEAEADMINFGKKPTLDEEFEKLILDDEIEKELQRLKSTDTNKKKDDGAP